MNIRKVYNLPNVKDKELWPVAEWCNHDAFFLFAARELDDTQFNYQDAQKDERVKIELKAYAEAVRTQYTENLEYVAISFDGSYVGLLIGLDTNFGYTLVERYITNYPKFQAMVAYVKTMYQKTPDCIIGETTKIDDLDGRYGTVIDKRYKWNMRQESERK